ncbi:hypothetical protein B0T17DRAFT_507543 [Bombardia bombarda]|uniref:Uncharacterized protein n=1 Tax=Bombardia bombarda TaxID=252184 RepID=A0AA39XBZ3_9PEZI|nr:hypothetical protein B0T17DRAFT_507543 [Bombardia bombarda]
MQAIAKSGLRLDLLTRSNVTHDVQDLPQSGHLPNHNLDPNIVGSSSFSNIWTFTSPDANELWLAKPLVFTPGGGGELVITSSEKNIIRVLDAKTGVVLQQRTLQPPFSAADSNCGDIPNWIGITGTPIIDPATSIMYLFSKGYKDGTTSGTANGVYKMYALRIPSLENVAGFPVLIDGMRADNDKSRYFVGGVALQRPSLTELNGYIVAGFGSHCGHWNYTGYLLTVSKTPGVGPVSMLATEAAPGAPSPQALDLTNEQSGKAGIWQSGMGFQTIGSRVYFVTGNGQGHANGNIPASGRLPITVVTVLTVPASTTSSETSTTIASSSTSSGPTAATTEGYYYIGCFSDTNTGPHALPNLFANNSVTPELAIAYVNSVAVSPPSPTPRPPFLFMEYHHEVYGGSSFNFQGSAVTSLVGTNACHDYRYGSVQTITATNRAVATTTGTVNYCGGPGMFDLYALETTVAWPTTGGPVVTSTKS